jgi:hypothetical protein
LALALALSFGVTGMAEAAARKPKMQRVKKVKIRKTARYKQSRASKVKPRKAPKRAHN